MASLTRRYFDWAASACPGPAAPSPFGNPSSRHREGKLAREALENARSRCAAVLGVQPRQLFFTSGATESNAIVLFSLLMKRRPRSPAGAELLYSAGEHPSIRENCGVLETLGIGCAPIGLDRRGMVSEETLRPALEKNPGPRMAAVIAVNNETGSINDMAALTALFRERQGGGPETHVHCDLVQGAGKIPLDITGWGIDSASVSAHKIGGMRGIGLLYLRKPLVPLMRGGGQEGGMRPGTENTAGALSLAACLEERAVPANLESALEGARRRMGALVSRLRGEIPERFIPIPADRGEDDPCFSPWILQARFKGIPGEVMVRALDEAGFAISTGSACSSGRAKRPVLEAMGLDEETRLEGVRISQGWSSSMDDIEALAKAILKICGDL